MTVLHRQTAGGVEPQRLRKSMIAVAMGVVGVGAAFGLSQVMGSDSAQVEPGHPARVEAGAAYGAALDKAAEIQARTEAGAAYGAALESARQAQVWTLDDELNAIRGGKPSVGSAAIAANAAGLDSELEALRGGTPFGGSEPERKSNTQNIKERRLRGRALRGTPSRRVSLTKSLRNCISCRRAI